MLLLSKEHSVYRLSFCERLDRLNRKAGSLVGFP